MKPCYVIDHPPTNPEDEVYSPCIVSGWFVDERLRRAHRIHVRCGTLDVICDRIERPDVVDHFKSTPLIHSDVGFSAQVNAKTGKHRLIIEAETKSGAVISLKGTWLNTKQWPQHIPAQPAAWQKPLGAADSVLVLIPVKPGTGDSALNHARNLAERALRDLPAASRIVFDDRGRAAPRDEHPHRIAALADIRQAMVEHHLRDERWIFWADLDLLDYPGDLITTLIRRSEGGISAPLVFMHGALADRGGPRFYDLAGFVEAGRWATINPPYFRQSGPIYDLDSVGSCYLVPADLYRRGARHEEDAGSRRWIESRHSKPDASAAGGWENIAYTEHFSVCAFARRHGLPVRAFADLVALHEHVH